MPVKCRKHQARRQGDNAVLTQLPRDVVDEEGVKAVQGDVQDVVGERVEPECGIKEAVGIAGQGPPVVVLAEEGVYAVLAAR